MFRPNATKAIIKVAPSGTMRSSYLEGLTNSRSAELRLMTHVRVHAWLVVKTNELPGKNCPKTNNVKPLQTSARLKKARDPSTVRLFPTQDTEI